MFYNIDGEQIEDNADVTSWHDFDVDEVNTPNDCFEMICSLGYDYDGYDDVNSLKMLIDELVEYAELGRQLLREEELEYKEDNDQ